MTNHHLLHLKKCLREDIAQLQAMSSNNQSMISLFNFLIEIKENIIRVINNELPKTGITKLTKIELRQEKDKQLLINLLNIEEEQIQIPNTLLHKRITSPKLRTKLSLIIEQYALLIERLKFCMPNGN